MAPYKKALVLPDMHCPHEDKRTIAAVYAYMESESWDYVINLGDFLDFNCISRWTKDTPRLKMGERMPSC